MPDSAEQAPVRDEDDPALWLDTTPLLDLDDPKLRLRAQALTQLCKTEREKALAVYRFVKRIPLGKPYRMRPHTAREVLQMDRADPMDKATLLVALLRLAGLPARVRYVSLHGEVMRGLLNGIHEPIRPIVEVHREGRWVGTDTYIFDAPFLAAALPRLRANGWSWGYGVHVAGDMLWDGVGSAYVGKLPPDRDPMVLAHYGAFCDMLEFISSPVYRAAFSRVARAVQWNMLAVGMERCIRELRADLPETEAVHCPG